MDLPQDILVRQAPRCVTDRTILAMEEDLWGDYTIPFSQITSLSASNTLLWCVGENGALQYAKLSGPGLLWMKAKVPAQQIVTSSSGCIVWRLYQESVYAVIGGTARKPTGEKWMEVVKDVKYIAVDDTSAW